MGPPPSPLPAFYLTVGEAVSCLAWAPPGHLAVGSVAGSVRLYCCATGRQVALLPAFPDGGLLWVAVLGTGTRATLLAHGRVNGLKVYKAAGAGWEEWDEVAEHCVTHQGFCRGLAWQEGDEGVVAALPSGQGRVMVARVAGATIRPLASLAREGAGTLMALAEAGPGRLLAGWENGEVVVWDWREDREVAVAELHGRVGTVMALAWDTARDRGLVAGSENQLVTVGPGLEVLGERQVTNAGLGAAAVRADSRVAAAGGWDGRVRLFSWRRPERLRPVAVLQFHSGPVEALAFSPGPVAAGRLRGRGLLAAGGKDGKVSLWDVFNDLEEKGDTSIKPSQE
jgi:WD40 repeat protein